MFAAVAAGVVAFLSPCVLPLIPAYISFISGMSRDELMKGDNRAAVMKKAGLGSVVFVAGFTAAFVALGATATALGAFLMQYLPYLSKGAGALIILFGLHSAGILKIPFLYRDVRYHDAIKPGLVGAFLMGLAFAFGWTPCVGPVLAGILALAAKSETVWQGMGLLSLFSVGLGVPFILTGFSVNGFLTFFNRYKKYIGWGEKAAGGLLVVMGLLMLTDNMGLLLKWIPEFFYKFAH
ncbi:MAG: cytochrome c biogenesis protein CcdA [Elusimicrobia bacterium]|nr:cytochrome c biogenesis protein CcdA [Elusimicrobiota bacterium]